MTIQAGFQKQSRKRSSSGSVGSAFTKGSATGGKWAGMEKFGDIDFLKSLLGRAGTNIKNTSGQIELQLMAQLGDIDAIQLLRNRGFDAKDALGLSSLHAMALSGDIDAERLLENRGLSVRKRVTAEDIDGFTTHFGVASEVTHAAPASAAQIDMSPLKKSLAAAGQRIQKMSRALQKEKSAREKSTFVMVKTSA